MTVLDASPLAGGLRTGFRTALGRPVGRPSVAAEVEARSSGGFMNPCCSFSLLFSMELTKPKNWADSNGATTVQLVRQPHDACDRGFEKYINQIRDVIRDDTWDSIRISRNVIQSSHGKTSMRYS